MPSISRFHHPIFILKSLLIPKERKLLDLSLYLVANRPSFQDENLFFSKIKESVEGGVSCVQYRDDKSDFATTLKIAQYLKKLLKGTPLFINTLKSIEVARSVGAEGVFLENPFPYSEARKLLGRKAIIGIPVRTMDQVLGAGKSNEIDYLSVKISPSKKTCPRNDEIWGIEGLEKIRNDSPHRIVAIGGLNLENAESIYKYLNSNDGIAMAGGLMNDQNPRLTAQKIQMIRQGIRGEL